MEIVADEWTANDGPSPLAQWLNTKGPDYSLDGAIEILALATASFDPATALVWAQSILDPDNRSMLEIVIGREWIRRAPDQAADNLPMLLESEAARAALLEPVDRGAVLRALATPSVLPRKQRHVAPLVGPLAGCTDRAGGAHPCIR